MSNLFDDSVSSRFWLLAAILALECLPATMLRHPWLRARTFSFSVIFFGVALLFFGRDKLTAAQGSVPRVHKGWAYAHGFTLLLFIATNLYLLYFATPATNLNRAILCVWYTALAFLPVTLAGALFRIPKFFLLLRGFGVAWTLAALCTVLMVWARNLLVAAWYAPASHFGHAMQTGAFRAVEASLRLFYRDVVHNPGRYEIGTSRFSVAIADTCSGIEGLALILSLTVGWIIYSRRELRLARAFLLVPASLVLVWLLNVVRITALIAIGDAGYPAVAIGGFHSEAGAILFSGVALTFLILVNRVTWFRTAALAGGSIGADFAQGHPLPMAQTNLATVYLLPFLAILAAGLLAGAASAGFEWLYCLRLIAGLTVFYAYRREYRQMDWRFGWLGPAAGLAVFVFWIALAHWTGTIWAGGPVVSSGIAAGLARLSTTQRVIWIAIRIIAAVVTVPLAEELAFRGFLARRLMSPDVETVSFQSLSVVAIFGSSLAFGLLHGKMWFAGMLSGLVFASVAKLRGRLGEAVAAHATTNLLIALWVLARHDYSLW